MRRFHALMDQRKYVQQSDNNIQLVTLSPSNGQGALLNIVCHN